MSLSASRLVNLLFFQGIPRWWLCVFHTPGVARRCLLRWPFVNTLYSVASMLHKRVGTAGLCIGQSCLLRIGKERKDDHLEANRVCVDIKARVEEQRNLERIQKAPFILKHVMCFICDSWRMCIACIDHSKATASCIR